MSLHREFDFVAARQQMVARQLRRGGIRDERVLAAMGTVPREAFVPADRLREAYEDGPLPIGFEQTISQPFTVAFMAEALRLQGDERVLEIGTGSGYGAAVLSRLAREVHTTERIGMLAERAEEMLRRLGFDNVHVHFRDGSQGLPEQAPFDAICVTAAAAALPPALLEQLAPHGRMVIPVGEPFHGQRMKRYSWNADQWVEEDLGAFAFVPLISG